MRSLAALAERWRKEAEQFSRYGDTQMAHVCILHAEELVAAIRTNEDVALNLAEASIESGYSPDRLRHMVSEGTIPNAGEKGRPRIRRGDLPKKKGGARPTGFDAAAAARQFLD